MGTVDTTKDVQRVATTHYNYWASLGLVGVLAKAELFCEGQPLFLFHDHHFGA